MDVKKVLISFIPWVVFSVLVQRVGVEAVGIAALLAALVGGCLAFAGRSTGVKLLDIVSTATFAVLAAVAFVGGSGVEAWGGRLRQRCGRGGPGCGDAWFDAVGAVH